MVKIAPSVLASDFSCLGDECRRVEAGGADMVHLDVMDGHFVPNITFGAPVIKALRPHSALCFDAHLMISEPFDYIDDFADAGVDSITFHVECESDVAKTLDKIAAAGCRAALSIKPKTPAEAVFPYLDKVSMILVMTVEPGFGGQAFIPETLEKIKALRREINGRGLGVEIQVDGGINLQTVAEVAAAGADVYVAGSALFRAEDMKKAIADLRLAAENALNLDL